MSDSATPWTVAYQVLPSMGFSRQEYWSGLPLLNVSSVNTLIFWCPLIRAVFLYFLFFSFTYRVVCVFFNYCGFSFKI